MFGKIKHAFFSTTYKIRLSEDKIWQQLVGDQVWKPSEKSFHTKRNFFSSSHKAKKSFFHTKQKKVFSHINRKKVFFSHAKQVFLTQNRLFSHKTFFLWHTKQVFLIQNRKKSFFLTQHKKKVFFSHKTVFSHTKQGFLTQDRFFSHRTEKVFSQTKTNFSHTKQFLLNGEKKHAVRTFQVDLDKKSDKFFSCQSTFDILISYSQFFKPQ